MLLCVNSMLLAELSSRDCSLKVVACGKTMHAVSVKFLHVVSSFYIAVGDGRTTIEM